MKDERLPIRPADLVPRSAVASYPTDFAAMSQTNLEALTTRGEQLMRSVLPLYHRAHWKQQIQQATPPSRVDGKDPQVNPGPFPLRAGQRQHQPTNRTPGPRRERATAHLSRIALVYAMNS